MAEVTTKAEILRKLFIENGLNAEEDVHTHKHYKIITRSGIDKIMAKNNIQIKYEPIRMEEAFCIIKGYGRFGDKIVETFGSASKATSNSAYYAEMAEKRVKSRLVLMLAGLYEHGVFGQDEADSFNEAVK